MYMAPKTRKVDFLRHHHHAVRLMYRSRYSHFIKGSERTQIDDLDGASCRSPIHRGIDDVSSSSASFQYHRAPGDNRHADWSFTNTQVTCFAYWQRIVAIGHIPVLCDGGNDVTLDIFGGLGAIEASSFQKCYG